MSDSNNISSTFFTLSPVCKKPIEMSFSAEKISSDGGWIAPCHIHLKKNNFLFRNAKGINFLRALQPRSAQPWEKKLHDSRNPETHPCHLP